MEIYDLLRTSLLLNYYHAVIQELFLKPPSTEKLNSPACVRVWEQRGEHCSLSHRSSCAHKGKYLCWASAWQHVACLFSSLIFLLCFAVRAFIILLLLSLCLRPSSPTPTFSFTFSVSTAPSHASKHTIPSSSLNFPPYFLGSVYHQLLWKESWRWIFDLCNMS